MEFSNKFKIGWWIVLLIIVTVLCIIRSETLLKEGATQLDLVVFVAWIFLALFPIVGEVNMFGFKIRKDIKDFRKEVRGSVSNLKSEIQNKVTVAPVFNIVPPTIKDFEDKKKIESIEIKEQLVTGGRKTQHFSSQIDAIRDKAKKVEGLVGEYLAKIYGNDKYATEVKFSNEDTALIADAAIIGGNGVEKIIEIQYFSGLGLKRLVQKRIDNFDRQLADLHLGGPALFVIVSENISEERARKVYDNNTSHVDLMFFKLHDDKLEKINI